MRHKVFRLIFIFSFACFDAFSEARIDIIREKISTPKELQLGLISKEENKESVSSAFGFFDNFADLTFDPLNIVSRKFGLYLRGSLPGQLKVEIDGENQVDPTSLHREARFDLFIPLPFTSIEVSKGPQTVLSSGGASAGLIKLKTNTTKNFVSFGVGSFEHTRMSSQIAGKKLVVRLAHEKRAWLVFILQPKIRELKMME